MASLTEHDSKFKETMGAFFHDLLRAAGITMLPGNSHERIRSIGERMASAIEHASERKSIQVIKKLQAAVATGFEGLEGALNEVKALVVKHHALIENLKTEQDELKNRIESLEARNLVLMQGRQLR